MHFFAKKLSHLYFNNQLIQLSVSQFKFFVKLKLWKRDCLKILDFRKLRETSWLKRRQVGRNNQRWSLLTRYLNQRQIIYNYVFMFDVNRIVNVKNSKGNETFGTSFLRYILMYGEIFHFNQVFWSVISGFCYTDEGRIFTF